MSETTYCEPTPIWRLRRDRGDLARAVIVPTWSHATLIWWINSQVEGAIDFASIGEAAEAAEQVRAELIGDGWIEID